ncbi:hypothetical protein EC973_004969, partial [Apophysomyces ossiformis]
MSDIVSVSEANVVTPHPPINQLPHEILLDIFTRLSERKQWTLVCVCRLWYDILIPELYYYINITTDDQFSLLRRTVKDTAESKQLGHFVLKLEITVRLDKKQIASLRQLFPFVRYLGGKIGEYPDLLSDLPNWKRLEQISYKDQKGNVPSTFPIKFMASQLYDLELDMEHFEDWMNILIQLPSISHLTLGVRRKDADEKKRISFSDLDKLIDHLPRLVFLTVRHIWTDGELPETVLPCNTLIWLNLDRTFGNGVGHYFARKCNNIEVLYLNCDEIDTDQRTLLESCRQLEKIQLDNDTLYRPCMDILQEIGAPMEEIHFHEDDMPWICKMIHGFRKTVTSVDIVIPEAISITEMLIDELQACRSLESLFLQCYYGDMDIDWILDRCNHLQELTVLCDTIGISDNYHASTKCELKGIFLSGDYISDDVLVYLERTCPNLSSLAYGLSTNSNRSCTIRCLNP